MQMNKLPRYSLFATLIGHGLECYDGVLFSSLASIIALHFFPPQQTTTALLTVFGTIAGSALITPLAGLVFGHYGDTYSRQKTIAASMLLVGICTSLVGLLPGYQTIGLYATASLITLRLLFAIASSGEYQGTTIYLIEHYPIKKAGFVGSWVTTAGGIGYLFGYAASLIVTADWTPVWAWRLAFVLGLLVAVYGYYIRIRLPESPVFNHQGTTHVTPAITLLKQHKLALLWGALIKGFGLLYANLLFIFMPTYLHLYGQFTLHQSVVIVTLCLAETKLMLLFTGWISDRLGWTKVMMSGCLATLLFAYPLFSLLQSGYFGQTLMAITCLAFFNSCYHGPVNAVVSYLFTSQVRYTGFGLSLNLGRAILGASTSVIVFWLIQQTKNPYAPAYYLMLACSFAILILSATPVLMRPILQRSGRQTSSIGQQDASKSIIEPSGSLN